MFDEAFGLRVGQVLARNKDMLVKGHVHSVSVLAHFKGQALKPFAPAHERLRGKDRLAKGSARIHG